MKIISFTTKNGLELEGIVIYSKDNEVIVYAQNRLVKCNLDLAEEIEVLVDWCIIPELQERLYELSNKSI